VAAEESEQPGVLGNLPRSRPGQRSEKRAGAGATTSAGRKTPDKPRPAAKRAATSARTRTATRKPAAASAKPRADTTPEPAAAPSSSPDPITAAFRVAGKVAEVGLKTAGGILRRLPGR
jgi:hypothetical protein